LDLLDISYSFLLFFNIGCENPRIHENEEEYHNNLKKKSDPNSIYPNNSNPNSMYPNNSSPNSISPNNSLPLTDSNNNKHFQEMKTSNPNNSVLPL